MAALAPLKDDPHFALVLQAEKWLKSQSCKVLIRDPFRALTKEHPDAIGWRGEVSILVEVKVSRSDFLSDAKKSFRQHPEEGMGDWRFYMCPPDVIQVSDLPEGWGLLWVSGKRVVKVHGLPPNTQWWSHRPFVGNKLAENTLLVSALRRLTERGRLWEIYG